MPRYALLIEYDGRPFAGWQRQAGQPSVQAAVEEATVRFTGATATVHCAGRTDAGVHALGQVAHVDLDRDWPADTVAAALSFHLKPLPVVVLAAALVPGDFNARTSAIRRRYRYRIVNRRPRLALADGRAWHVGPVLDVAAMQGGAAALIGHHDFSSFRASHCQARSPVKTLDRLDIGREDESILIVAEARSFLHHQVRNMVGTLVLVGQGQWAPERVGQALAARDRRAAGPTAPSVGLYLVGVDYPGFAFP